ncbi:MAG: S8 family serine peptidase [Clostridiales bacterium]|nr:S8 family serine peptidase [Clostridiales bacterium]
MAGNTTIEMIRESGNYQDAIINHSVEDPGQSWNCITVGAYTEKEVISDPAMADTYKSLVHAGSISPFSSSSISWDKKWPIKPEVMLEGGNLLREVANPDHYGLKQ